MKYHWLGEQKTCDELGKELGCNILGITKGGIIIGYDGEIPIIKQGVEIEFDGEPTAEQLAKLTTKFPMFKREGSKGFFESVQDNLDLKGTQKDAFKLSKLCGLTQAQLETYIDNNVGNLAQAKEFLKKLAAVVLYLVKQTKLDQ